MKLTNTLFNYNQSVSFNFSLLFIKYLLILSCLSFLAACSDTKDIRNWMKQQKEGNAPIPQFHPPPPPVTVEYNPEVIIDPFKESRAVGVEYDKKREEKLKNKLAIELAEKLKSLRGNPLELNSLAEIKMVGYLNTGKRPVGMVLADGNLYRVQTGDLLGNKFGVVQSINEESITVIEKVAGNDGKFVDRKAILSIGDQGGKTR